MIAIWRWCDKGTTWRGGRSKAGNVLDGCDNGHLYLGRLLDGSDGDEIDAGSGGEGAKIDSAVSRAGGWRDKEIRGRSAGEVLNAVPVLEAGARSGH